MKTVVKNLIEKYIAEKQYKISILSANEAHSSDGEDIIYIQLKGGLNGCGRLSNYLSEIKSIVDLFNNVHLIEWNSDNVDDIYYVTLAISF